MENEVELKQEALQLKQEVADIVISTQEQYGIAAELLTKVKSRIKRINDWFDPLVKAAYATHKAIKDQLNETLAPAIEAEGIIKNHMQEYVIKEDRKRKEIQDKLNAEAEKKRRELEEKARIAAESGNEAKAEKYEQKAQDVVQPILAPPVSSIKTDSGTTYIVRDINVTVINPELILQQVFEGKIPITVVEISRPKLKSWVKTMGIKTCPGLVIELAVPRVTPRGR